MPKMTDAERKQFLSDLHVGVLAIADGDKGPLTAPIWYDYEPGGRLWMLLSPTSRKGRLLEVGTRVSLVAQTEAAPYRYVSVEGPVVAIEPSTDDIEPMAIRYLGEAAGKAYAANSSAGSSVRVEVDIERWLTTDYGKAATD